MHSKKSYISLTDVKKTHVVCINSTNKSKLSRPILMAALLGSLSLGIFANGNSVPSEDLEQKNPIAVMKPVEAVLDMQQLREEAYDQSLENRKQTLVSKITARYKVDAIIARKIVDSAHISGENHEIDPVLLLAITAVESTFNPNAVSPVGAVGLTQALPRAHPEKFARIRAAGKSPFDTSANLDVGGQIYAEYRKKFNGNRTMALQKYNGSLKDKNLKYSNKVMVVYQFLSEGLPTLPKNTK